MLLPIRSAGPVPRFSPRIVTLVHAAPSLGEMPVTSGGGRARDMAASGKQELEGQSTPGHGKHKIQLETEDKQ